MQVLYEFTEDGEPPEGTAVRRLEAVVVAQQRAIEQLRSDFQVLLEEVAKSFASITQDLQAVQTRRIPTVADTQDVLFRDWRELGAEEAGALWGELEDWLGWLHSRYPLRGRLPACWWRHPAAVEEVTALYRAWRAAYGDPHAARYLPLDWHARWLPAALERIRAWVPSSCRAGQHVDDHDCHVGDVIDDRAAYAQYVAADVAVRQSEFG